MVKNNEVSNISLIIKTNYPDFKSFYKDSQELIYRKVLYAFEELKKTKKDKKLVVTSEINDHVFDTDFDINIESVNMLMNTIIPFFEKIEDYETCSKIVELYSDLSTVKE